MIVRKEGMIYSENANKYFDTFLKSFAAGICIGAVFMWFLLYGFNKRNRSTLNE